MNRKQRKLIIDGFRLVKAGAEEGERLARAINPIDIGAVDPARHLAVRALQQHAADLLVAIATIKKGLTEHIGASAVLDAARYPRAKTLSASRDPSEAP